MMFPTIHRRAWALAAGVALASCGGATNDGAVDTAPDTTVASGAQITVAVAFFPIEDIVRGVGGDAVEIVRLVEPGMPAHDAELTASTLDELSSSDVVFYLGENFQPAVEKAIGELPSSVTVVDLYSVEGVTHLEIDDSKKNTEHGDDHGAHDAEEHDEHDHGDEDPHIWLDPSNMEAMSKAVAATLTSLDPTIADTVATNTETYVADLTRLGREIDDAFGTCTSRTLVTAHDAFGHFARRAKLETASITGVNPQDQPSAKELEAIADVAREAKVSTVFFEAALPDGLSRAVADAIGASVDVLDTIETVSGERLADGSTYASLMRDNIRRIAAGLGCA